MRNFAASSSLAHHPFLLSTGVRTLHFAYLWQTTNRHRVEEILRAPAIRFPKTASIRRWYSVRPRRRPSSLRVVQRRVMTNRAEPLRRRTWVRPRPPRDRSRRRRWGTTTKTSACSAK